uniref:Prefoldin subunit 5 n=1 Tax=Panagrellus redivivus TaxID=6233 RepID=A0A7E4UT49_PANRE
MTTIKADELHLLPPQQLAQLIKQTESEVKFFSNSLNELKTVVESFKRSEDAVLQLVETGEGKECLIPLTDTIHIKGKTGPTQKFLIDVGTGYFAEMTAEEATSMFTRKRSFVTNQIDKIEGEVIPQKRLLLELANAIIEEKVRQSRAAAGQA